jgi:acyl-coenzyme A thioesterase PaaI-like protein
MSQSAAAPNPLAARPPTELDEPFLQLVEALRRLQDALGAARPPVEVSTELAGVLAAAADRLTEHQVAEAEQLAGRIPSSPGRGQALVPPISYDLVTATHSAGTVSFGRAYLGGNMAAHGGAIPLAFDEIFGQLAGAAGRPRSRTAYLHVNYRAITPIGPPLRIEAEVVSAEGRKLVLAGALRQGEQLLADAEGLFVLLNPGQP